MRAVAPIPRKAHQASGTLNAPPFPLPPNPKRPTSRSSNKELVCYECGASGWLSSSALSRHQDSHLTGNEKPNNCRHCGKGFSQATALKTHQNIHLGRRPHLCRKGCSQTFSDPSSRTRHEKELHDRSHGWKCSESGCSEIYKRKSAFRQHMENAHNWLDSKLPDEIFTAAKNKCANDYVDLCRQQALKAKSPEEEPGAPDEGDSDKAKPLFNGKRLRSSSISSDKELGPPPTKKQALEPSFSRRNAVGTIEMPSPHLFTPPHVEHKRGDSDGLSTSTASSLVEAFSGAYHPAGHVFTNGSPSNHSISSDRCYPTAMGRVGSPTYTLQAPPAPPLLYPGDGGYNVTPDGNSPRAPGTMPEGFNYQYSSTMTDASVRPPWSVHGNSYGSQWALGNEVAQTPHGVGSPMAYDSRSPRGALTSTRSGLLHGTSNNGIHLPTGHHQIEHSSASPTLDPRLDHTGGPFGDHQALARSPGEHTHSTHPDPHVSMGMYMLDRPAYSPYSPYLQQMPRTITDGSDQGRSYS